MQLSQKQKLFSQFFSAFSKSRLNFEDFKKRITRIAYVFLKLWIPKNLVKQISKKTRFRGPFDINMVRGTKQY